jgi:tripartite-type tricarboxylate transporter receptor subunit TctC
MKLPRRQFLHLAAGTAVVAGTSRSASVQAYPARPVHILVGLAAGGPTDAAARILAEWLSRQFGQQFLIENRTGMAGNLANQALLNSPPDGYTLLFTGPNTTISASLYKKLPFNFLRDAVPVAGMMQVPNVMVVPSSLPVKTVQDFIDYAMANPGQLSMASSGVGASPHLSGELFKFMTKIEMVHMCPIGVQGLPIQTLSAARSTCCSTTLAGRYWSSCVQISSALLASRVQRVGNRFPIFLRSPRPSPAMK